MAMARIELEPLRAEHADEMVSVLADPELYRFTGGEPSSRADLTRRYQSQVAGSGDPKELWLNWIIRRCDTGEPVGFVQADVEDEIAELAWVVGVKHQRQGIAVEAARAMVAELEHSGVKQFTAHIHMDHRGSQGVAAALGMTRTGELDDDGEEIWGQAARNLTIPHVSPMGTLTTSPRSS